MYDFLMIASAFYYFSYTRPVVKLKTYLDGLEINSFLVCLGKRKLTYASVKEASASILKIIKTLKKLKNQRIIKVCIYKFEKCKTVIFKNNLKNKSLGPFKRV